METEKYIFIHLILTYAFVMLAKAKTESAPAKPVNEDNVLHLPSQKTEEEMLLACGDPSAQAARKSL